MTSSAAFAASDAAARPAPVQPTRSFTDAVRALCDAADSRALHGARAEFLAPLLRGRLALRVPTVDLAADAVLRDTVRTLLTHGWTPRELHAFAEKRLDDLALTYLVDILAATAHWSAGVAWLPDLAAVRARVWWTVGEPHLGQWARRHDLQRIETIRVAVDVLALVSFLPRTDEPQPGSPAAQDVPPGSLVQDDRIVGRIDALLARADGSDHPGEAAACTNKAQELMVRYATVPATPPSPGDAAARALKQLVTESPMVTAKTVLGTARSGATLGRAVLAEPVRLVRAVGAEVAGIIQRAAGPLTPTSAATPALEGR